MTLKDTFIVNEIYPCLQGEGTNLGKPSILIRLQICNLRCTWCDTPYTHTMLSDPVDGLNRSTKQNYRKYSVRELVDKIHSFHSIRHVILSGGEPTLQNLSLIFAELNDNYSIEVETNGTQIPHLIHSSFKAEFYYQAQWNVSPKGKNAGQKIEHDALKHWAELAQRHPKVFFKFVIREQHQQPDLEEINELIKEFAIPETQVIVMAEGTTIESQTNNQWIETICMSKGWTLSPRLHVLNHGNKRGV
jgi:7-carboxy-7-deazaguanine synthase